MQAVEDLVVRDLLIVWQFQDTSVQPNVCTVEVVLVALVHERPRFRTVEHFAGDHGLEEFTSLIQRKAAILVELPAVLGESCMSLCHFLSHLLAGFSAVMDKSSEVLILSDHRDVLGTTLSQNVQLA